MQLLQLLHLRDCNNALSEFWKLVPTVERMLFKTTPNDANTSEKPMTKYTVFKKMLILADFFILMAAAAYPLHFVIAKF